MALFCGDILAFARHPVGLSLRETAQKTDLPARNG